MVEIRTSFFPVSALLMMVIALLMMVIALLMMVIALLMMVIALYGSNRTSLLCHFMKGISLIAILNEVITIRAFVQVCLQPLCVMNKRLKAFVNMTSVLVCVLKFSKREMTAFK